MTSLTSYKDFSDEELSKKYLENLALYDDQIVIMETLTTKVREVRVEIHFLQEQLLKRGYKIKEKLPVIFELTKGDFVYSISYIATFTCVFVIGNTRK